MRVKSYDLKTLDILLMKHRWALMKSHENVRMLEKRGTQGGQTGCQSDKLIKD